MNLIINGKSHEIPLEWREAPLLTVLRDYLGYTGTKFGCGKGVCGACSVNLDGSVTRSCVLPVNAVGTAAIITIEGLAQGERLHPVQKAWIEYSVPQCGYCQSGQLMTAAAFLESNPDPSVEEVTSAMSGNLCRCGTYLRIRKGVLRAAELAKENI